jgi:hypothetical protein
MSCLKVEGHSQSRPSSPLQLHRLSTLTSRNKLMSSYSIPIDTSFYDTLPNDNFHIPYTNQSASQAEAGIEGSYYYPPTGGELTPYYPTYNGFPLFQTAPSLSSTTPSAESPASWEVPWSHSSDSISDDLFQLPLRPNAVHAHWQPAVAQHGTRTGRRGGSSRLAPYSRRTTSSRLTIGKNKGASTGSTGYAAKLVRSFQIRLGI